MSQLWFDTRPEHRQVDLLIPCCLLVCRWGPAALPVAVEAPGSAGRGSHRLRPRPGSDPGPAASGPPSWPSLRPAHNRAPSASYAATSGPETDPVWTEILEEDTFFTFSPPLTENYMFVIAVCGFGKRHSGKCRIWNSRVSLRCKKIQRGFFLYLVEVLMIILDDNFPFMLLSTFTLLHLSESFSY